MANPAIPITEFTSFNNDCMQLLNILTILIKAQKISENELE
jgi:hypothetical protein